MTLKRFHLKENYTHIYSIIFTTSLQNGTFNALDGILDQIRRQHIIPQHRPSHHTLYTVSTPNAKRN